MKSLFRRFTHIATLLIIATIFCSLLAPAQSSQHTVWLNLIPDYAGTASGGGTFDDGTIIHVSAEAAYGYRLDSIDINDFPLTQDIVVNVYFGYAQFTVTALADPPDAAVMTGGGPQDYLSINTVDYIINPGFTFDWWEGEQVQQVLGERTVIAHFTRNEYIIDAYANPPEAATMTGAGVFHYGDSANITYTATPGYRLVSWSHDPHFKVTGDAGVTANFEMIRCTVTVAADPPEAAIMSGEGVFDWGTPVSLSYSLTPGYHFVGWSSNPEFVASDNVDVVATFEKDEYYLVTLINGLGTVTANPELTTYHYGDTITITVAPAEGYAYSQCSIVGQGSGSTLLESSNTFKFVITENTVLTAAFDMVPTIEATNLTVAVTGPTSIRLDFTPGNGQRRLIIRTAGPHVTVGPVDGNEYYTGYEFVPGTTVVYTGVDSSFQVFGLAPETEYCFRVFEYTVGATFRYSHGSAEDVRTTLSTDPATVANMHAGDDRVSTATVATTAVDNVTLEGWVRWGGSTGTTQTVLLNGNSVSSGYGIVVHDAGGERLCGLLGGVAIFPSEPAVNLPLNVWTHVAFERNSNQWQMYVNGVRTTLGGPITTAPAVPNTGFFVGGSDKNNEGFNGAIDEVRVSTIARYFGDFTPTYVPFDADDHTVLLWRFDEESGTTALDASRNGNNGTFLNGVERIFHDAPLPVELTSFVAKSLHINAVLTWKTASETENAGFEIERSPVVETKSVTIPAWTKVGFVRGNGTRTIATEYRFTDAPVSSGRYAYRLRQLDQSGRFKYSSAVEVMVGSAPLVLSLEQNYPNPFNPATTIEFTVPVDGHATLRIYNMLGQMVATLFDGIASAGVIHHGTFDASKLASGIYFSRLECGGKQLMKRMVLMK